MNAPTPAHDDAFETALTWHVLRRRMAAGLIDLAFCLAVTGILFLFGILIGVLTFGFGFALLALLPAVPVLYNWLFLASMSATPGQRMMGLIVRRNDDLGPPNPAEALVWALGFALTMTLTAGLLWLLVVLLTARKRALHDIVPDLAVIRVAALAAHWAPPR